MIKSVFKRMIAFSIAIVSAITVFGSAQQSDVVVEAKSVNDYNKILLENKKEQERLNALIAETHGDATREKENQKAIEQQIAVTQNNINTIEALLSDLETKISDSEKSIVDKEKEIENGVNEFKNRIRAMYISGNESMITVLLGSDDFYDMLMKYELVKRVAKHDNDFITELLDLKSSLEAEKEELEENKSEVEKQNQNYQANKSSLENLYSQSKENLNDLEAEEQKYKNQIEELKELDRKAEAEIQRLIEEARLNSSMGEYVGGTFIWPVPGFSYISSYYGTRWGRLHKGIDIAGQGIQGQPVVAANAGVVIVVDGSCTHNYPKSANCCGNGYGRYVVVDHGGGMTTLYGHLQDINVQNGQYLNIGDKIGTVGSTGFSTGYHLHFEIRKDGYPDNPMNHYTKR